MDCMDCMDWMEFSRKLHGFFKGLHGIAWNLEVFASFACGTSWAAMIPTNSMQACLNSVHGLHGLHGLDGILEEVAWNFSGLAWNYMESRGFC